MKHFFTADCIAFSDGSITKLRDFPISIGSTKKAVEHLEKAVKIGPKFFLNRLFLAEACISNRDKKKANERLEFIIKTSANKNHEIEDENYKRQAESLLESL